MNDLLQEIRIILVETSHPGNIGATARAMKTMGLQQLRLVNPKRFPDAEATARAAGADDILAQATVHESLDDALADCQWVCALSARLRQATRPTYTPNEAAALACSEAKTAPVALVFGNEQWGLTNAHMTACHAQVCIPTQAEYRSLNLAAAVQICTYELRQAALANAAVDPIPERQDTPRPARANHQQMTHFYHHLHQVLVHAKAIKTDDPARLMAKLQRLFNRARPEQVEVRLLRGILTAWQRNLKQQNKNASSAVKLSASKKQIEGKEAHV